MTVHPGCGEPHHLEDPAARVEDVRAVVDYLQSLDYVDSERRSPKKLVRRKTTGTLLDATGLARRPRGTLRRGRRIG